MSTGSARERDAIIAQKQPVWARRALDLYESDKLRPALVQVDPSQMRTVLSALERAGSYAEAEIVLRYQSARLRDKWSNELVEKLLALFREAAELGGAGDGRDDELGARAIARQFGLIVRVHRIAHSEREASKPRGGRR